MASKRDMLKFEQKLLKKYQAVAKAGGNEIEQIFTLQAEKVKERIKQLKK